MCLNTGTPKIINFPFGTNGKLMVLGVPIFKHFRVTSVDLAHYGVSRAKDWVSVDCGTNSFRHPFAQSLLGIILNLIGIGTGCRTHLIVYLQRKL